MVVEGIKVGAVDDLRNSENTKIQPVFSHKNNEEKKDEYKWKPAEKVALVTTILTFIVGVSTAVFGNWDKLPIGKSSDTSKLNFYRERLEGVYSDFKVRGHEKAILMKELNTNVSLKKHQPVLQEEIAWAFRRSFLAQQNVKKHGEDVLDLIKAGKEEDAQKLKDIINKENALDAIEQIYLEIKFEKAKSGKSPSEEYKIEKIKLKLDSLNYCGIEGETKPPSIFQINDLLIKERIRGK
jgi:hypothetical protein